MNSPIRTRLIKNGTIWPAPTPPPIATRPTLNAVPQPHFPAQEDPRRAAAPARLAPSPPPGAREHPPPPPHPYPTIPPPHSFHP